MEFSVAQRLCLFDPALAEARGVAGCIVVQTAAPA